MTHDQRNVQLLLEQLCGPLDEILTLYPGGLSAVQRHILSTCREQFEELLLEFEALPDNPDGV